MKWNICFLILTVVITCVPIPTMAQSRYTPGTSFDASSSTSDFWGTVQSGAIGCASGQLASLAARGIGALTSLIDKSVPTTNATLDTITSCLNSAAYAISKTMLQKVTDNTLKWVNTGFNGAPLYIKDQQSYFNSIYSQQIAKYLKDIPQSNTLFGTSIRDTLLSQLTGQKVPTKTNQTTTPEQQAYQNFNDDFRNGGWGAWLNATQNANNNPIGAYLNTVDQLGRDSNSQIANVQQELLQGNGFLSMKKCVQWDVDTSTVNATTPDIVSPTTNKCLKYETTTPGKIIGDQLAAVTTSTVRQLENIDQYNEVLQGFFKNLLSKLFTKGVGGYTTGNTADFAASSTGPGANAVLDANGNPITSGNLTGLTNSDSVLGNFDISRPQQLQQVAQVQYNFINTIKNTQQVLRLITPHLGKLDYCIPGPNPTWSSGLQNNFDAIIAGYNNGDDDTWKGVDFLHINYSLTDKAKNEVHSWQDVTVRGRNESKIFYTDTFKSAFQTLNALFTQNYDYGSSGLGDAFASTAATQGEKDFARGFAVDAIAQTQTLVPFSQTAQEIDDEYQNYVDTTQQSLAELESIRKEVNSIVKTAKARYIKDMADKGTPVNLSCINRAYIVDENRISPTVPFVSNVDPVIQQSKDASEYFYSTLPGQLNAF